MRTAISLILVALLLRASVALGPHSGQKVPPMRGDFEAQRHWMEITSNLPVEEWYVGRDRANSLDYWGLDYPPLTAYHSWAFGKLFQVVTPESVELFTSRGIETSQTKIWMRFTALVSDALTFIPAVIYFMGPSQQRTADLLLVLASPALILVDHGHFQFNCVAHGLAVLSWALLHDRKRTSMRQAFLASVLFSLSLNFKQMSLYYAPVMFSYLLGWAMTAKDEVPVRPALKEFLRRLVLLGIAVIVAFGVLWAPFIYHGTAFQVLRRVFPFERGLFEDKVANFWCTTNVAIKWRTVLSRNVNVFLAFLVTIVTMAPSCLLTIFKHRGSKELRLPLFTVSLSFFLFSFQVHEKSILLPLVPALLLIDDNFLLGFWFSLFATISMTPLFVKDGIVFTSFALMALYILLAALVRPEEFQITTRRVDGVVPVKSWTLLLAIGGFSTLVVSSALIVFVTPPARYPDLFVVIHNSLSFVVFFMFWLYGNNQQLESSKKSVESADKVKKEESGKMAPLTLSGGEDENASATKKKRN